MHAQVLGIYISLRPLYKEAPYLQVLNTFSGQLPVNFINHYFLPIQSPETETLEDK